MSFDLLGWLGAVDGDLKDGEFRVLFRLCWHANQKTGASFPSIKTMSADVGATERSVMRHIKSLEEKKYIEVIRERWPDGTQKQNKYIVLADITYRLPNNRTVTVKAETPVQEPGDSSVTRNVEPGDNLGKSRVTAVSPIEQGSINKEVTPITYGNGPPTLFSNDSREIVPATPPSLPDYVRDGLAKLAEDFPRIQVPRVLNDSRKRGIIARASEVAKASNGQIDTYQVWDMMFTAIRQDRFLRGEAEPTQRYPNPFSLSVDYLLRPRVFLGILDKAEIYARDYARNHTTDGRSIGPTERALRETLASLAVSRQ